MAFILGKKLKMTQIWKDDKAIPVTLVQAGPVTITQIRTKDKDKYEAVQVGFDATKKKLNKPLKGHLEKIKNQKSPPEADSPSAKKIKNINFRYLREFRVDSIDKYNLGDQIDVSVFQEGDKVKVSGITKGKGFQGVVKRHGFHGGPKTHGQKNRLRAPGSIGSTAPQRVMPGRKMAGRMGGGRVTIKSSKVAGIDKEKNILMLKGAVPGRRGTLLEIQK